MRIMGGTVTKEPPKMTGIERCDEIIRLIDQVLVDTDLSDTHHGSDRLNTRPTAGAPKSPSAILPFCRQLTLEA